MAYMLQARQCLFVHVIQCNIDSHLTAYSSPTPDPDSHTHMTLRFLNGGGAMGRDCPVCDGACGAEWRRAVEDSLEAGEAHWVGACAYEWWIDEPALPDVRWARLQRSGKTVVIECDGLFYGFASSGEALRWLNEEEYIPFTEALAGRLVPQETLPPQGAP